MKLEIDQLFYLKGDEDGNVCLMRLECNTGGAPTVFYTSDKHATPYGPDMVVVHTISDLMTAGTKHAARHRAKKSRALTKQAVTTD